MKPSHVLWFVVVWFAFLFKGNGQDFVNLDFEDAIVSQTPVGGAGSDVNPGEAFPGWRVSGAETICYNNLILGNTMACLIGPKFPNLLGIESLQGSYSAWLLTYHSGDQFPGQPIPGLSQTAMVPPAARSISFLATSRVMPFAGELTLGGTVIPLVRIGEDRLAGDVSAFAGQIQELTFSGNMYFDDIKFSSFSIPEPSSLILILVTVFYAAWWSTRPNQAMLRMSAPPCQSKGRGFRRTRTEWRTLASSTHR